MKRKLLNLCIEALFYFFRVIPEKVTYMPFFGRLIRIIPAAVCPECNKQSTYYNIKLFSDLGKFEADKIKELTGVSELIKFRINWSKGVPIDQGKSPNLRKKEVNRVLKHLKLAAIESIELGHDKHDAVLTLIQALIYLSRRESRASLLEFLESEDEGLK